MDVNWSYKPPVAVAFDQARLFGASAAAPTVLPAPKVVRPAAESASTDDDADARDKAKNAEIALDHDGYQVIYRVRDADSRRVMRQVPTLRLRAYARAAGSKAENESMPKADIEA